MAAVYRHSLDYGRIRLWGSLAFILGSLATGRLLAAYDADWVLWLVLGALAASAVGSEEHTSELQSLMRISYAVFCLKKKKTLLDIPTLKETYHPHVTNSHYK